MADETSDIKKHYAKSKTLWLGGAGVAFFSANSEIFDGQLLSDPVMASKVGAVACAAFMFLRIITKGGVRT